MIGRDIDDDTFGLVRADRDACRRVGRAGETRAVRFDHRHRARLKAGISEGRLGRSIGQRPRLEHEKGAIQGLAVLVDQRVSRRAHEDELGVSDGMLTEHEADIGQIDEWRRIVGEVQRPETRLRLEERSGGAQKA